MFYKRGEDRAKLHKGSRAAQKAEKGTAPSPAKAFQAALPYYDVLSVFYLGHRFLLSAPSWVGHGLSGLQA
jgi:hypothetical protein